MLLESQSVIDTWWRRACSAACAPLKGVSPFDSFKRFSRKENPVKFCDELPVNYRAGSTEHHRKAHVVDVFSF